MTKKKPLSKRAKSRQAFIRRDPFGRLTQEIGRYLETVGWRAVVISNAQVRGYDLGPDIRIGRFEFVVKFTGGKKAEKP